ncbi:hypothetical protein [Methylomonas methanica]|uniref:Lipoprotein n=1 Tax=Methylomonas methanica (strain DSM 25384 / MC09) TaxID=857087 RepID=G0A4A8_METMM|nr:hypothetical protein [Methylomonas methanica]AEG00324.1 hypothetical protein Metme_1908 [Methylomonas methanica MC09]
MKKTIHSNFTILSAVLVVTGALVGCSSQPTLGERMIQQSSGTAVLGERWEAGSKKVAKGEKLIKDGNALIKDARDDMRKGENKVSDGQALVEAGRKQMAESERQYQLRFPNAK